MACMGGDHSSVLALLLDAGGSINARSNGGWTPLMLCVEDDRPGSFATLIDRGDALDLNAKDREGCTALLWAAVHNRSGFVQLLLHAGAEPTIRNIYGESALNAARSSASATCTPLLEAAFIGS